MSDVPSIQAEVKRARGKSIFETLELDKTPIDLNLDVPGVVIDEYTINRKFRVQAKRLGESRQYNVAVFDETKIDGKTAPLYLKGYFVDCEVVDDFAKAIGLQRVALKHFNERGY
ncbi:MAG: hypothetical protein AABX11_00960 [Nanoarchaeota archaeon]